MISANKPEINNWIPAKMKNMPMSGQIFSDKEAPKNIF